MGHHPQWMGTTTHNEGDGRYASRAVVAKDVEPIDGHNKETPMRTKFFISLPRAWLRGMHCGYCLKLRQLGYWRNAEDKTREGYFCAECFGDMVARMEGELKRQSKGKR